MIHLYLFHIENNVWTIYTVEFSIKIEWFDTCDGDVMSQWFKSEIKFLENSSREFLRVTIVIK